MRCLAQRQVHLHRVVITDVEGLGAGRGGQSISLRPEGLPGEPIVASPLLYLLLSEPKALGEVEGGCATQQALEVLPVEHDAVIGAVGASPHRSVHAVSDGPVEAGLSPKD